MFWYAVRGFYDSGQTDNGPEILVAFITYLDGLASDSH